MQPEIPHGHSETHRGLLSSFVRMRWGGLSLTFFPAHILPGERQTLKYQLNPKDSVMKDSAVAVLAKKR